MKCTLERLRRDVMACLGELPSSSPAQGVADVPWPEEIMARRIEALLPEEGSRLILEASPASLGGGVEAEVKAEMRLMPCGLYAAEVRPGAGFLRLAGVRMGGWIRSAATLITPGLPDWECQWSPEAGIAGSPARPRAYLDSDADGPLLRLLGSTDSTDWLVSLRIWRVPERNEQGDFEFPEMLYPSLVGAMAVRLQN